MQWEGIELKEVTKPQTYDPPKEMFVWDNMGYPDNKPYKRLVCSINKDREGKVWTITQQVDNRGVAIWGHCAEIPEKKPCRATNRELARWLANGNGELIEPHRITSTFSYCPGEDNTPVLNHYQIRKWNDTEWHEPTVDYMGIEETENEV